MINELLRQKTMTKYQLSKKSNVPFTTISDICSGKTQLENCSAKTIYNLAKALNVSMESLVEPYLSERCHFEAFKSSTCHRVRRLGDIKFLIEVLQNDEVRTYYKRAWYPECLYLLAMVDYLSRLNNVPQCSQYNDLRCKKLDAPVFPASILAKAAVSKDSEAVKVTAIRNSIPEFIHFNIIESEVRNIV